MTRYEGLKRAIEALANIAGVFVAGTAAWCWYWAFARAYLSTSSA
jgi:hypothetical protein